MCPPKNVCAASAGQVLSDLDVLGDAGFKQTSCVRWLLVQ